MRYMGLLRAGRISGGVLSSQELLKTMGRLMDVSSAVPLAVDGIVPTAAGARVRLSGGQVTVTGCLDEHADATAVSYAMFEVKSIAEAIEWTASFLRALGEGECEIRPLDSELNETNQRPARQMRASGSRQRTLTAR